MSRWRLEAFPRTAVARKRAAPSGTGLARDRYWDEETRDQATELGLPVIDIDGTIPPEGIAGDFAARFRLTVPKL